MDRDRARTKVDLGVTLIRGGRVSRAELRDLSVTGAALWAPFPPGNHERIAIARNGLSLDARVVWARGKAFGVMFGKPLDPEHLFTIRR